MMSPTASPLAQVLAMVNRQDPQPPQATIAPTPVASIYAANDQQKMDAYKSQLAQQNAMYGALASLGGAAIGAGGRYFGGGAGSGDVGQIMSGAGNGAGGYPYMKY
jgi:hypothetical protein